MKHCYHCNKQLTGSKKMFCSDRCQYRYNIVNPKPSKYYDSCICGKPIGQKETYCTIDCKNYSDFLFKRHCEKCTAKKQTCELWGVSICLPCLRAYGDVL